METNRLKEISTGMMGAYKGDFGGDTLAPFADLRPALFSLVRNEDNTFATLIHDNFTDKEGKAFVIGLLKKTIESLEKELTQIKEQ